MISEGLSLVDATRGMGSGSGGQGGAGNESRNRVAARTTNQRRNRAGGPLGLVRRTLKKVCGPCGLSMLESLRLETSELTFFLVIGRCLPADYQYADG